jgi:hypothetical protein
MLNVQRLIMEPFVADLRRSFRRTFGIQGEEYGSIVGWAGRLALESIANSDALYHDVEHTMMVTLVGQEILKGRHLCEGGVTPRDWLHYMLAVLCHDIGYVRGVCRRDAGDLCATGIGDATVTIPRDGTDAALTPYHVDRSKLFIRERFRANPMIDADLVASYIEMTRFPVPDLAFYADTSSYRGLVRAADFIGQLGDPDYLRKLPALFYELEEIGANRRSGYSSPGEMRRRFAKFYWDEINQYIRSGLRYLQVTQEGKQWVANLYSHVFTVEHERRAFQEEGTTS